MKTCLIVDDSGIIRKVARRILESLKFQILEAENGEQAFDAYQRELPDAILLIISVASSCRHCWRRVANRVPSGSGVRLRQTGKNFIRSPFVFRKWRARSPIGASKYWQPISHAPC